MTALPLMVAALCVLALGYRFYSAFIAARVLVLDELARTPAHQLTDGQNFVPTRKWVLFGHHFAAITGAGPLIGPVLATQFGFLPGVLWILIGVVLGGAVQDFVILVASVRRGGRSLAEIAREEIGSAAGTVTTLAVLFIIVISMAAMGSIVVKALGAVVDERTGKVVAAASSWGTFTIACSIPIALLMGAYMYRLRKGSERAVTEATIAGVALMIAAVILGKSVPGTILGQWLTLTERQLTFAIAVYGFVASILPVWLLLCPRDYLSSFLKIGTIALLVIGVLVVSPELKAPALSPFIHGGGPIVGGKIFPFVFITIACGAISGFHSLVASGTTPKMIDRETDCRTIGYGAMLMEGLVGITALIAAASLAPADYYAINTTPAVYAGLSMTPEHLAALESAVGEQLQGRTGGGVSLAVGMAQIFSGATRFLRSPELLSYWYHFAVMFEALFILTVIDTGTRVGRFLFQEALGRLPGLGKLRQTDWLPGSVLTTLVVTAGYVYFMLTGSIHSLWPMLGVANQLLACIALCVGTTVIVNLGRARYAWVTLLPLSFVATTTLTAGWQLATGRFLPQAKAGGPGALAAGLNGGLTLLLMACVLATLAASVPRWLRGRLLTADAPIR
jgi:carbon starvation protein